MGEECQDLNHEDKSVKNRGIIHLFNFISFRFFF